MFLTRGSNSGGTTNLNRKRRRRPTTSPVVGRRRRPSLEALETRQLLSTYYVTNASDNGNNLDPGTGTLRQAIINANNDVVKGVMSPDNIDFAIPASTAPNLDVPAPDNHQRGLDRRLHSSARRCPLQISRPGELYGSTPLDLGQSHGGLIHPDHSGSPPRGVNWFAAVQCQFGIGAGRSPRDRRSGQRDGHGRASLQ